MDSGKDRYIWITASYEGVCGEKSVLLLNLCDIIKNLLSNGSLRYLFVRRDVDGQESERVVNIDVCGKKWFDAEGISGYGEIFSSAKLISFASVQFANDKGARTALGGVRFQRCRGVGCSSRWNTQKIPGYDTDCQVQVAINIHEFKSKSEEYDYDRARARELCDRIVSELAALSDIYQLIVHAGDGLTYSFGESFLAKQASVNMLSLRNEVDNYRWRILEPSSRQALLYGFYWGMLLGPKQLKPLGGKKNFIKEYEESHRGEAIDYYRSLLTRYGDGLFIRVSRSPLDVFTDHRHVKFDTIGPWLHMKLVKANLLSY